MPELTVHEVYTPGGPPPFIAEDEGLDTIIHRFAAEEEHGALLVQDHQGHLVGFITPRELLKWATLHLAQGARLIDIPAMETIRLMQAQKARDVARPTSTDIRLHPEDSAGKALFLMLREDLHSLPVCDAQGTYLGTVRLSRILLELVRRHQG